MTGRPDNLEPMLNPEQIAELAGVNYHGVLKAIRAGELKAAKVGKGYRIDVEWYRDWIEGRVVVPIRSQRASSPAPVKRHRPAEAGSVADLDAIEQEEAA